MYMQVVRKCEITKILTPRLYADRVILLVYNFTPTSFQAHEIYDVTLLQCNTSRSNMAAVTIVDTVTSLSLNRTIAI